LQAVVAYAELQQTRQQLEEARAAAAAASDQAALSAERHTLEHEGQLLRLREERAAAAEAAAAEARREVEERLKGVAAEAEVQAQQQVRSTSYYTTQHSSVVLAHPTWQTHKCTHRCLPACPMILLRSQTLHLYPGLLVQVVVSVQNST
jgi:multidrug efflux pump subunit AcrA (membrane-fusion protein)